MLLWLQLLLPREAVIAASVMVGIRLLKGGLIFRDKFSSYVLTSVVDDDMETSYL